jgi:hypothetical protein
MRAQNSSWPSMASPAARSSAPLGLGYYQVRPLKLIGPSVLKAARRVLASS